MVEKIDVILDCCGAKETVQFRHTEAPALSPNQFRKNVTCPACGKLVILTMTKKPKGEECEQEIVSD